MDVSGYLSMFFMFFIHRVDILSSAARPAENNIPMEAPLDCLSHPFKADLEISARICKGCFLGVVILLIVTVVLFACCWFTFSPPAR